MKKINEENFLAIITARGGSKGIKNKNLKTLGGKPLVYYPINAALKSKFISKVVVSTDSKRIAKVAVKYGAEVPFIRPKSLALDATPSFDVIKHCLEYFKRIKINYKNFILLEPTSPLTKYNHINSAITKFLSKKNSTSLVGVSQIEGKHPDFLSSIGSKGFLKPYNARNFKTLRRQDISELYFFNGSLYIANVKQYLKNKTFLHKNTLPFIMDKKHSFEVDDLFDLSIIRAIFNS